MMPPRATNPEQPGDIMPLLMPAEWETHAATWLAWPHNHSDWPGKYDPIPWVFADVIRHLVRGEDVHVVVNDRSWEEKARAALTRAHVCLERVEFHRWPTDRVWVRDSGAIFVRGDGGGRVALNWRFNAWAKYSDWKKDDQLAARMARHLQVQCIMPTLVADDDSPRVILEGGSIDVNGHGTMLTTEECLLSPKVQVRNPGVTRDQLECVFRRYLGVRKVIWLERGIVGDDTHGHIDDIARFVAPDTVIAVVERNSADPNYEPLQVNLERLRQATDQDGHALRVVELPMPAPVLFRGQRLPASYANFYITNVAVLVPTFNDPNDRIALNILSDLFPGRSVIGIHCGDLVWGLGTIHCTTQQQPE